MTNVEQVEKWFALHQEQLSKQCTTLHIKSQMPSDEARGKVLIDVETPSILASVTFWNQGDVEVITVNKALRIDSVLDDRRLTPSDNVESLLNRYFQQIVDPESRS